MITKEQFIRAILTIQGSYKKQIQANQLLSEVFPDVHGTFTPVWWGVDDELIKLLMHIMNDECEYIAYFMHELNFGAENYRLKVYDKEKNEIPLSTVEDLWNLLTKK
jgi:hypothetical protein